MWEHKHSIPSKYLPRAVCLLGEEGQGPFWETKDENTSNRPGEIFESYLSHEGLTSKTCKEFSKVKSETWKIYTETRKVYIKTGKKHEQSFPWRGYSVDK